jgi:hypothetical protein
VVYHDICVDPRMSLFSSKIPREVVHVDRNTWYSMMPPTYHLSCHPIASEKALNTLHAEV